MALNEKEALEIAKTTNDHDVLMELAADPQISKRVRLEILKRKDEVSYGAKFELIDTLTTEADILWSLIADRNPTISRRAFVALADRLEGPGIPDKYTREDFIEYVVDLAKKQKRPNAEIGINLISACYEETNDTDIRKEIIDLEWPLKDAHFPRTIANSKDKEAFEYAKSKNAKLFESNKLEQAYIRLAESTESKTQLQKLTESEFENVREIAKSRL